LIAGIIDTNNDREVSAGDTITFNKYPNVAGGQGGTFLAADSIIDSVVATDTAVTVEMDGNFVYFEASDQTREIRDSRWY
jgi:hypothetical protein